MRIFKVVILLIPMSLTAQGGFTKGEKGNDYIIVTKNGYHFAAGPTYTMTNKPVSGEIIGNIGDPRAIYHIDPSGSLGFFAEAGLVQFPMWKGIPINWLKKSRIMDYWEFALGFRQLAGLESTTLHNENTSGAIYDTTASSGGFRNGFLYGRASAHFLIFTGKKKIDKTRKYFIDQGLGFNIDYLMFPSEQAYYDPSLEFTPPSRFHSPLVAQFHYSLGFGIRINRAWICVPGVSLPIIGIYEWNNFTPKLNWFSSGYWPIQGQLRFIKLFERVPKCGVYGNPDDMELDKKFRLGQ
ncbi:MAG: hypothetical protein FJZ66_08280 [Bacteroidetes bacterium]|nr:hypothetical protein [Bacteroidota bacterium]